ncbi:MAG: DNA translocase FtsK 4TM domain-containing protein, partial [Candidatus Omnitrophica bacterium]|nr:DNA translocase FtsK 4TM domain-containing protein [Candidatus Omnitrophota bacterium]
MDKTRWNEIQAILLFAIAILIFTSLITFNFQDLSLFTSNPNVPVRNFAGLFGVYIGAALFFLMGLSSYVIPLLIISWAVARLYGITPQKVHFKLFGTLFLILASSSIFSLIGRGDNAFRFSLGGIAGLIFSDFLVKYLGRGGAILVITVLFLLSVLLATEFLLLPFLVNLFNRFKGLKEARESAPRRPAGAALAVKKPVIKLPSENRAAPRPAEKPEKREPIKIVSSEEEKKEAFQVRKSEPQLALAAKAPAQEVLKTDQSLSGGFKLPGLELLDKPPPIENRLIKD